MRLSQLELNQQIQSNTALSIPKPRQPCLWTYKTNKDAESRIWQESTPNGKRKSNSTMKHSKTWNSTPARNKARGRWKLCHSPWIILPLKNLSRGANWCQWTVQNSRLQPNYEGLLCRTQRPLSALIHEGDVFEWYMHCSKVWRSKVFYSWPIGLVFGLSTIFMLRVVQGYSHVDAWLADYIFCIKCI